MAGKAVVFMNLYRVSINSECGQHLSYDSYDEFVICCESDEVARCTHPGYSPEDAYEWWESDQYKHERGRPTQDTEWIRPDTRDKLTVVFLGQADPSIEKGVICSSFNAG